MACVGRDEKGDLILDFYRRLGIDCWMVQRTDKAPTSATILTIRPNGERPALRCRGASDWLFVPDAGSTPTAMRASAPWRHGPHSGDGRRTEREAHAPRQSEGPYDDCRPYRAEREALALLKDLLPSIDYFMPSLEEAAFLSGRADPADAASFFMDRGAGACIFKMGGKGSYARTPDGQLRTPAFKVPVSDTTGCGDAYCGGFVAGLVEGLDLEAACRLGAATAARVATGWARTRGFATRLRSKR